MTTTESAAAANDTAAADAARAAAEARRQRILNGSKDRMAVASGGGEGDKSKVSKMQAMRRRRAAAAAAAKKKEAEASVEEEEKEVPTPETVAATTTETAAVAPTTTTDDDNNETTTTTTTTTTSERKYMGVAKMRRKKMKERQQQQQQQQQEEGEKTSAAATMTFPSTTASSTAVAKMPIVLHALTVIMLFVAGLDVGFHPDIMHPTDALEVHVNYALQDHGVGVYTNFVEPRFLSNKDISADELKKEGDDIPPTTSEEESDEFEDTMEDDEEHEPVLDPLFGVDLDLLTSGPGLLMMLARGAVKCHRMLLWLCYELPVSIMWTMFIKLPTQFWKCPPLFCVVAVMLRQGLKMAGAGLPSDEDSDDEKKKKGKQSLDVLAMMKNTVIKSIQGMFPNAVSLYRVWTDVRADMYVVLCGMFVGLAYTHQQYHSELGEGQRDEL